MSFHTVKACKTLKKVEKYKVGGDSMIFEREDDRNRRPLWLYLIPDSLKKWLEDVLYSHITRKKVRRPKSSKPSSATFNW